MIDQKQRDEIIGTIVSREYLRPMSRARRLATDPLRAFPYYVLAAFSHIKPYKINFKTLWGDSMEGYLPEANTFYYYGTCEANLTSFLLRFLKEGQTFIDVGAHIGFYSVLASRLIGKSGRVHSFEPTPWTFDLLSRNTKDLQNISVNNAAVGQSQETVGFDDYGPGYGAYNSASNLGTILTFKPKHISTKTITLDAYVREKSITADFIKLDAEGLEEKILAGMADILTSTNRPLITLEMANDSTWSKNYTHSSDILLEKKYRSYEMTDDGFIKECTIKQNYTYSNILFVPEEKVDMVKVFLK